MERNSKLLVHVVLSNVFHNELLSSSYRWSSLFGPKGTFHEIIMHNQKENKFVPFKLLMTSLFALWLWSP